MSSVSTSILRNVHPSVWAGCHSVQSAVETFLSTWPVRPGPFLCYFWALSASEDLFSSTGGSDSKESAHNAGGLKSVPGSRRSPGKGNGNPSSILAWRVSRTEEPGRLAGYGPWGCKGSDTTERLTDRRTEDMTSFVEHVGPLDLLPGNRCV